jgi:hypothetical protein
MQRMNQLDSSLPEKILTRDDYDQAGMRIWNRGASDKAPRKKSEA